MDAADSNASQFFAYRFDPACRAIWWPLGAREGVDGVTVTPEAFRATFGRWRLETPMANVADAHITTDYRWWKAVGTRLSFADDGLTFGTATHGGVCVHFAESVRRVIGFRDHSALTVTVDDLDGLAAALQTRSVSILARPESKRNVSGRSRRWGRTR